jgi:hypothetical protein
MSITITPILPGHHAKLAQLQHGPQTHFNKRLWQTLRFALIEFERLEANAPVDYEYFERLCIMNGEALLLSDYHLAHLRRMKDHGRAWTPADNERTNILRTVLSVLDVGFDQLEGQFDNLGLIDATDRYALAKAIFYHMQGLTTDEAQADADAIRALYAEIEAQAITETAHG